jgi:hypothetical protein
MLSASVEDIRKIGEIREKLFNCSTEEEVNGVFTTFGITDLQKKTMLLRQSMQVQEVFDAPPSRQLSDEDAYKEEMAFFVDGKWRELV